MIKQTSTVSKSRVPNFETFPCFSGTLQCVVSMEILLLRVFLTRLMLMYYVFCMLRHLYTCIYIYTLIDIHVKKTIHLYTQLLFEKARVSGLAPILPSSLHFYGFLGTALEGWIRSHRRNTCGVKSLTSSSLNLGCLGDFSFGF